MKRPAKTDTRKLRINGDRIRQLGDTDLDSVRGGDSEASCGTTGMRPWSQIGSGA